MNNITVYSHFFTVQNVDLYLRRILYSMAADYTVFNYVWDDHARKKKWKPVKTYGFYSGPNDEFRFHIGQLDRVLNACRREDVYPEIHHVPLYEPVREVFQINPKYVLRSDQEEAAEFILNEDVEGAHSPLLSMPMGSGKEQPLTAKILTPTGWSTMGEMYVGAEVLAWDGSVSKVTGVYPQGLKDVWGFEFEDGRKTKSGLEHLWSVYVNGEESPRVITTKEIIHHVSRMKDIIEIDLPQIKDIDNKSYFERLMSLNSIMPSLFILDDKNWKHSVDSKETASLIVAAVRSLNGVASVEYNHAIDKWVIKGLISAKKRRIRLTRLHLHAEQEECQCISIDHPQHLYVTDDFIVTHNTVTALTSAARLGRRLSISVLAGYVKKWQNDVLDIFEIDPKDIYTVEGSKRLVDYCQTVVENQNTPENLPKVTIISLNTIGKWYKRFIEDPYDPVLEMYGMKPYELMEKAKIGTNIFDEAHQHLHYVYSTFCFLHIPKTISLSATLTSIDETELRIQRMMYPRHKRFEEIKMKRYITVYSCQYQVTDYANSRIRTTEYGSNNYSHTAFEKSILANSFLKHQYINMIVRMVKGGFYDTMQKGDKCAVFVSTHAMAKEVCKALRREIGELDIRTYLESDPLENLMDSDIRVTTVLSGGTAHDIKGLTVSIQTINLNSIKSNLQVLGRLREIKDRDCRFYYLYCSNIPKHIEYHKNKIEQFQDWCKERKDMMLDPLVGQPSQAKHCQHFNLR